MTNEVRTPRVFIGLREMSGYYSRLKKGFDALGVPCVFLDLGGHPFRYPDANNPPFLRVMGRLSRVWGAFFFRNLPLRVFWTAILQNVFGLAALLWALPRFDAFILASNSTFFFFLELPLLRLLGKKIVYVLHGSESRPVYLNGYVLDNERRPTVLAGIVMARLQRILVGIIERYASAVVTIPPQAHFHRRPFLSWWIMGIPFPGGAFPPPPAGTDPGGDVKEAAAAGRKAAVRILHAPSKPGPKGTDRIRRIVQDLRDAGFDLEYVEITGRPNAEVLAELSRCDFIIDEIYSDTPMAVFAAEAAFFGKPAVVGSYYAAQILEDLAPEHIPPSLFVHPDLVSDAVRRMVEDRVLREDLGKRARAYVQQRWEASAVARRYLAVIDGRIPPEWLFPPRKIRYLHGCGLSEERARRLVAEFLHLGGPASLCLGDKPVLRDAIAAFAARKAPS